MVFQSLILSLLKKIFTEKDIVLAAPKTPSFYFRFLADHTPPFSKHPISNIGRSMAERLKSPPRASQVVGRGFKPLFKPYHSLSEALTKPNRADTLKLARRLVVLSF